MSNLLYDFLTESFLFRDDLLQDNYIAISDVEIKRELGLYREFVLKNVEILLNNINDGFNNTTVFTEMHSSNLVGIDLLKQCSLYVHKFVIDDPLFRLTEPEKSNIPVQEHINEYLGFSNNQDFDRRSLVNTINYLKMIIPGIVTGYVKLIPGALMLLPLTHIVGAIIAVNDVSVCMSGTTRW